MRACIVKGILTRQKWGVGWDGGFNRDSCRKCANAPKSLFFIGRWGGLGGSMGIPEENGPMHQNHYFVGGGGGVGWGGGGGPHLYYLYPKICSFLPKSSFLSRLHL
jgi:hypothetical protein